MNILILPGFLSQEISLIHSFCIKGNVNTHSRNLKYKSMEVVTLPTLILLEVVLGIDCTTFISMRHQYFVMVNTAHFYKHI